MVLDLSHGKRVYDWLGKHNAVYRAIRFSVCFGRERWLQRAAIDALAARAGETVLDLACGAGVNLPFLEGRIGPTGKIIAVDYSEGMLETARKRAKAAPWANIEFRQADAAQLDLPDHSLDRAICTFGLSAMPRERAAIRRVAAALKPGAPFVALDAKAFTGLAKVLNPIAGPFFKYATNWDYKKDVIKSICEYFDDLRVTEYNCGCNFIAVGTRSLLGGDGPFIDVQRDRLSG